jgi:hypothetical protein
MRNLITRLLPLLVLILIGCASEVLRTPVVFNQSDTAPSSTVEVTSLVTITLSTGYERSILTGSRWERIGAVPQGGVYRPVGTVFTIEGANMHEAYLVLRESQLVGFYLPAERSFSALDPAVRFPFKPLN